MPKLGLGLQISNFNESKATQLAHTATMFHNVDRAQNNAPVVNSPFTNPIKDISYNGTDLTIVNAAETTADGYEDIVAPNGSTVRAQKLDGVDTYGLLPNVAGLDPTGLADFGMAFVIKTGATIPSGYIYFKNLDTVANAQIGLQLNADASFKVFLGGSSIASSTIGAIQPNTFYKVIVTRKNENLVCSLDDSIFYNQPNSTNLTSQPNTRMFARSASADGTTHSFFFNGHYLTGSFALTNIDEWERKFDYFIQQQYGL